MKWEQIKGQYEWLGANARRSIVRFCKRWRNKAERRKAKQNPECQPTYTRYKGWAD